MSYFLFHLWNHNRMGKRSLEDVIGIMGKQLHALGHGAQWDPTNDVNPDDSFDLKFAKGEGQYNIIVEGFSEDVIDVIAVAHSQGSRFICLATEEPTPKGFNHGVVKEMVKRQEMFPKAAVFFDGILHLVPGQKVTDWYNQFAPAFQCDLGYAPSLVRQDAIREPKYDFGFFGSLSPRRHTILKRLRNRSMNPDCVRIVSRFPDQVTRDKLIQDVKVVVQLRLKEQMGLVSTSRCNTALHLGRPIIAEPHEHSKPWNEIVKFADSLNEFYTMAYAVKAAWRSVHAWQMEKFKEKLSPQACVGFAIDAIDQARKQRAA